MKNLFTAYRVLAMIVGVLLAFGAFVALPAKYLAPEGSSLQEFGDQASLVWVVHGWVFIIYVVVSFLLSRRAGWTVGFTVKVLAAGLIPLMIFWVERQVVRRLRSEHPELASV